MARDLDEMEDDNPIDSDFEGHGDTGFCLQCGKVIPIDEKFCSDKCQDKYEDGDDIPSDETFD